MIERVVKRPAAERKETSSPRLRSWLLGGLAASVFAYAMTSSDDAVSLPVSSLATILSADAAATAPLPVAPPAPPPVLETTVEVRRNDTLSALFERAGLTSQQLHALLESRDASLPLKKIYPGETLVLYRSADSLVRLDYRPDVQRTWIIEPAPEGYTGRWDIREFERRVRNQQVVIENSLYQSALEAGLSESLILQAADIFGWDIDFALDIRRGDQLALVHEELWLDGKRVRDGVVLAARFVNDGKVHEALRFERSDGGTDYFDPEGRSMRKQFLRTPVDFRRISSRYRSERWHPVLGVKRPHRGVDYAASPGTPVRATGDGKLAHVGVKGGYGNTVIVRHGQSTQTLYGHLKGFARGLRAGQGVRQGQVIGYVGSTGISTGPHLHYEFQINGVHRNPLTVKLPDAAPLAKADFGRFAEQTAAVRSQLALLLAPRLARAD